ncbi:armadillo repeat-containing protein 10 [Pelodytes ibericus]
MFPDRAGTALKQLLALAAGAGACYYLYKMIVTAETSKKERKPSSISDQPEGRVTDPANNPQTSNLEAHHLKELLKIVSTSSDSGLREMALVTLANSAAFSKNHDIIRNMEGIKIIGEAVVDHCSEITVKAFNALTNLSMNLQNQDQIKDFLHKVCQIITSASLNSDLLLAGLRLITNMSVTDSYHNHLIDYIPFFLYLLAEGNTATQIQASKILVNLSGNASMSKSLLSSKAPQSLMKLYDNSENKDLLGRVLSMTVHLLEHLKSNNDEHHNYDEDSLHAVLNADSAQLKTKLSCFLEYPEVKDQVAKLILLLDKPNSSVSSVLANNFYKPKVTMQNGKLI